MLEKMLEKRFLLCYNCFLQPNPTSQTPQQSRLNIFLLVFYVIIGPVCLKTVKLMSVSIFFETNDTSTYFVLCYVCAGMKQTLT